MVIADGETVGDRLRSMRLLFGCRGVLSGSMVVPSHGFPISLYHPMIVVVVVVLKVMILEV